MKPHRIAAGGIIVKSDAILLVRYNTEENGSYLVSPGGALKTGENATQAIIRETMEETGVTISPYKILWIEDLECSQFKMCKIWMLCDFVSGQVIPTDEARVEGIVEAAWFNIESLKKEVVYPPPIMQYGWNEFYSNEWKVQCLPSRTAGF